MTKGGGFAPASLIINVVGFEPQLMKSTMMMMSQIGTPSSHSPNPRSMAFSSRL